MATWASIKAAVLTGAALGAAGLGANTALAGGFFVHEQSTYFQGTSFAGAAAGGPALSAMFWNPATITQQGLGLSTEVDATAIFPRSDITPVVATSVTGANLVPFGPSGDIGKDAFVAASYYVYGINNLVTIGFGLNAPFGLRTQPNPLWSGMFYSRESEVFSLNATPTVAFKLTDWLSVGVGAQIQYLKVKLHSAFPGSGTFPPFGPLLPDPLRVDGDSIDFGFTAGVTITPTAWTTIGLGYRSRIDHSLEGDIFRPFFITTAPPPLPPVLVGVPPAFVNFEADVPLPDIATVSIRQKITESFTLLGTVEWQNWSRLGTIPVAITSTPVIPPGIPNALAASALSVRRSTKGRGAPACPTTTACGSAPAPPTIGPKGCRSSSVIRISSSMRRRSTSCPAIPPSIRPSAPSSASPKGRSISSAWRCATACCRHRRRSSPRASFGSHVGARKAGGDAGLPISGTRRPVKTFPDRHHRPSAGSGR
jgi:long-chain fatty acid transport protein